MKSALESHLQTRHADRPTLVVDAIADLRPTGDDCQNVLTQKPTFGAMLPQQPRPAMVPFYAGMGSFSDVAASDVVDLSSNRGSDEVHSSIDEENDDDDDNDDDELIENDNDDDECFYEPENYNDDDSIDYFITTTTRDDGTLAHFYNSHYQTAPRVAAAAAVNTNNNNNNNNLKLNNNNNTKHIMAHGGKISDDQQQKQHQKKRRHRTQMANQQVRMLRLLFDDVKTPTMADCELVGRRIGLPKRVVQVCRSGGSAKNVVQS